MTSRKRTWLIVSFVLVIGVGLGILLFTLLSGDSSIKPVAGNKYFIQEIRPNTFFTGGGAGVGAPAIGLAGDTTARESFAAFNGDFTTFTVEFIQNGASHNYVFMIVSHSSNRNVFKAELRAVIRGTLWHLSLVADKDFIVLRSAITMDVMIDSPNDHGNYIQTITRDSRILSFHRHLPPYFGG